jgi:hypothetical protein
MIIEPSEFLDTQYPIVQEAIIKAALVALRDHRTEIKKATGEGDWVLGEALIALQGYIELEEGLTELVEPSEECDCTNKTLACEACKRDNQTRYGDEIPWR